MRSALTIAGSDSGGGAGIQADLKTFAAHDVYGLSAVTAITAQNSVDVAAIHPVPATVVRQQIEMVGSDFEPAAVKTGMLATAEQIEVVADSITAMAVPSVVVDPVMRATTGMSLLGDRARHALGEVLMPCASVTTPNRFEAEALTGFTIDTLSSARDAARRIHDLGATAVVITGGHFLGDDVIDLLFDGGSFLELRGARVETAAGHGTGCTFSAALTAQLALGRSLADAVQRAKFYVEGCLRHAPGLGHGNGPLGHFWRD